MHTSLKFKLMILVVCSLLTPFIAGLQAQVILGNMGLAAVAQQILPVSGSEGATLGLQGRNLSPEQVSELETIAAQNPDDLRSQSLLLEYYFYNRKNDQSIAKKSEQMILRLIQHFPKAAVLSVPFGQLEPALQGYAEAESLWKEQLQKHPDDLQIIKNAGNSFMLGNLDLAISTFEHGKSIDPENIVWDRALAACYNLKTIRGQAK